MKFCVIGDPHFANRKMFGRPTHRPGVNSRLEAIEHTFSWIGEQLDYDEEISHVIVLGDITHDHGKLTPPVFWAARGGLLDLAYGEERRRHVTLLSGNHDQDANGDSIAHVFGHWNENGEEMVEIVNRGRMFYYTDAACNQWIVDGISYMDHEDTMYSLRKIDECLNDYNVVLCMHHHFDGAKHGAHEFQPPGGLNPADIPDCVNLVLSGHYHQRQWIDNRILYVGAPLQHDFGESTYEPGYAVVTIENDMMATVEFHEVPPEVAPRFHILPYNLPSAQLPGLVESDYYRIDIPYDADMAEARQLAKHLTNVVVRAIPCEAEIRSRVEEYLEEQGKDHGKLELEDVIGTYAAMNAEPHLVDELVDLGLDIANFVTSGGD